MTHEKKCKAELIKKEEKEFLHTIRHRSRIANAVEFDTSEKTQAAVTLRYREPIVGVVSAECVRVHHTHCTEMGQTCTTMDNDTMKSFEIDKQIKVDRKHARATYKLLLLGTGGRLVVY